MLALLGASSATGGSYWGLNEVFSTANGSVQFVELVTSPASPQTLGSYLLVNERGQEFAFPMGNYPGGNGNHTFLLATSNFGSLPGAVQPDVEWLPSGFLSPGGGLLHLQLYGARNDGSYGGMFDTGFLSWSQLYVNGVSSYGTSGREPMNSPQNYAGQVGIIGVPEPSVMSFSIVGFIPVTYLVKRRKMFFNQ